MAYKTACTWRWGFCGNLMHFLRFSLFLIGLRSAVRTSTVNANRKENGFLFLFPRHLFQTYVTIFLGR